MPGLNLATELNDVACSHLAVQIRSSRPVAAAEHGVRQGHVSCSITLATRRSRVSSVLAPSIESACAFCLL